MSFILWIRKPVLGKTIIKNFLLDAAYLAGNVRYNQEVYYVHFDRYIVRNKRGLTYLIPVLFVVFFLVGCKGNNNTSSASTTKPTAEKYAKAVNITGAVKVDRELVTEARILVTDYTGATIITTKVGDDGKYSIDLPAGTTFPIEITAYPKAAKYKMLKVAVIAPPYPTYDITLVTTAVAKQAKSLGGYTYKNLVQSAMSTVAEPERDTTVEGFRGDYTKQYGGWH